MSNVCSFAALPRDTLIELAVRRTGCPCGSISPDPQPGISHSGGPRAGLSVGGEVGMPRWPRISRIAGRSVMKALSFISPPHCGHSRGSTS